MTKHLFLQNSYQYVLEIYNSTSFGLGGGTVASWLGVLNCGASAQGLSPGAGHCVVFLAQGVSLHPGI